MGKKSREKHIKKQEDPSGGIVSGTIPKVVFPNANKIILHFLLLTTLVFGVYAISINNNFVWDDTHIIRDNHDIKSFKNAFKLLVSEDSVLGIRSYYYRPVTYLSFMVDYALWKDNPKGYHALNILLHIVFTCLLYLFACDILGNYRAALLSSLFFGLHPAATETVNFIAGGRNTLLCGVFLLAALLFHRKNRLPLTLIFFTLSEFSKEFGLLFPVIAALTDRTFPLAKRGKTTTVKVYALYAAIAVFYLSMRAYVVGSGFDMMPETLPNRILLIPQLIDTYLKVIVFPYKLTVPYCFQPPSGITGEVIVYTVILMIVLALLYFFRKFATVAFSSFWFIIFLLPVINIIPLGDFVAAERYIYIALVGYAILLGSLSVKLPKPFFIPAVILVCAIYMIIVVSRNPTWKNDYSLFSDAVIKSPDCPFPHNNLGIAYSAQGKTSEAINEYQTAIKMKSDYAEAYNNLGNAYSTQGKTSEAINEYQTAIKIIPDYAEAHYNLGKAYGIQGKAGEAISEYQAAIKIKPEYFDAHNDLGNLYLGQGRTDEAINEYQTAIKIKPDYAQAHYNLGNAYRAYGKTDKAIAEYQIAIKINSKYLDAHNNLGSTYLTQGRTDEAISEYQIAVKIKPDYAGAHYNLGNAYRIKGRTDEAINEYRIVLQLKPDDEKAQKHLDSLLEKRNF